MNLNATILYVDDEPLNLKLFKINFEKKFNVLTAASGFQALKILEENADIIAVVSDLRMPGMDGLQFIEKAKNYHPEIACFLLTGISVSSEISDAIYSKLIYGYFKKPFDKMEVERTIMKAITN